MKNIEDYAIQTTTTLPFEQVITRITEYLKEAGFGIVTEIDMTKTFKEKINIDFKPFKILGACNPSFSFRALSAVPEISVFLPCNVAIADEGDHRVVSIMNPEIMSLTVNNPEIQLITVETAAKLRAVLQRLEETIIDV